jgi:hypothetical protein
MTRLPDSLPPSVDVGRQFTRLALIAFPFTLVGVGMLVLWRVQNIGWALPVAIALFVVEAIIVVRGVLRISKAYPPNDQNRV